ncbi:MAG: gliding motility lipoprotein GldB [Fulvivirga sp.]|nr:gliding motility lipoprotein GldB [Fulvivirga sp.]
MRNSIIFFCLGLLLFLGSCSEKDNGCVDQPDISDVKINLEVEALHDDLLSIESKEALQTFLNENPIITRYFLQSNQYPSEEVMLDALFKRFTNPHIDTLNMEINRVFGDLSGLKTDLQKAFQHLKYYYPQASIPRVKTVATGFEYDLYLSDSLIVIGLDYYLGPDAKYRPTKLFNYMLKRYAPEYIVPSIMLLYGISDRYNKTDISDNTILSDMIAYGKSFYFAKHMMPCTPDSILIWYNTKEIQGVRANQDIIWAHFVEEELLFETDHMVKKKYIDPRPNTYEIGNDAPGRIGTWLGWQIVKKYAGESNATLKEIMNKQDPKAIFNESKYKPDKGRDIL